MSEDSHNVDEMDKQYLDEKPSADFASLLGSSQVREEQEDVAVGQRVAGTIQQIGDSLALVDYGGRSEATIELQELKDEAGEIPYQPGDPIEAYVASNEGEIRLTLSLRASNRHILRNAYENKMPIEGRVTGFNTGGLVVSLGGVRAFCPFSQVDTGYCDDPAEYAGKTLTFRILEFRGGGRNVVLSRRAYLEAEASRKARELRDKLSEGAELTGKVTRLERFGAFVDIGGVEGLVHVSEISHTRVDTPRDALSVGQEVQVRILELKDLGGDKERISLSIKALQPDPWNEALSRLREGDVVSGKVVSLQKFGAFVELLPGVEGLVHISQLSAERRIARPEEVVSVGQEVQVLIQRVDRDQKRLSLSIKAVQQDAKEAAEAREIESFKAKQDTQKEDDSAMAEALRRAGLI